MGCDIHSFAEKETSSGYEIVDGLYPFDWRSYGMFGFLADVRNYSAVPQITDRRGFPTDASRDVAENYDGWSGDAHSASWISVSELSDFDYDRAFEDRRVTVQISASSWDGGRTAGPGGGEMTTFREFLGAAFFEDLERLKEAGASRVVFWFDN